MKYFLYPVLLFFCTSFITQQVAAQLFPGIRVNGRAIAKGDTINVCRGSSITYETIATGFTSIDWRFKLGTPATSTSSTPQTITYNTVGIDSTVQLIRSATNRDSTFIYVRVSATKPTANFNFAPDNVCGNTTVAFTNSSAGQGNSYQWNFEDGTVTTAANPSHQFLNAVGTGGTQVYNVQLIATNIFGCKDTATKPINIQRVPSAAINTAENDVTFGPFNGVETFRRCAITATHTFQFINQSTTTSTNQSYTIQWGDGSQDTTFTTWAPGSIIQHTYPIGNRTMTVRVRGQNGCEGIKRYNVFLGTNPGGGFISLGNTDICAPDSLRFVITGYNNNSPGTVYRVSVNDGSAAQLFTHPPPDTITHIFNYTSCGTNSSNGANNFSNSFRATLDIENPCASTSVSVIPILVSGMPRAVVSVSPEKTVCVNSNVTIFNGGSYGGIVTATGGGNSTCVNNGAVVWTITPATGYTLNSGTLGSLNGNHTNGLLWTSGSNFLNVRFNAPGNYTVKLYIHNTRCGMDSATEIICVRNPPQAAFSMSNKSSCGTGTTTMSTTSTAGSCLGDNYNWQVTYIDNQGCGNTTSPTFSFINNTDASSQNPSIQFNTPGKYAIQLTVAAIGTGGSCIPAIGRDTFTVKEKPNLSINAINAICPGNTVSPVAVITSCYADSTLTYNWTFTNGSPASATTAVPGAIAYNTPGTRAVKLDITNECGVTSATASVNVIAAPPANAGADKNICSDGSTTIGTAGTAGITYEWQPATGLTTPNAAITEATQFYTGPNADTVYKYVVKASAGINCFSTDTVEITVKKRPTVTTAPLSSTVCEGLSAELTAAGAVTYLWQPAAGLNVNNRDTVVATPAATTQYAVIGTAPNGCTDTATVTVQVQAYPNTNAGNDSVVCNNTSTVQFTGSPAGGVWSGNHVSSSGVFNPQAAGNGSYFIRYSATLNQCTKTDSLRVTVIDPPVAQAGNDTTVCQSSTALAFSALPAGGSWSGSVWITPGGSFTPLVPGTFTLVYSFGGGSCIATDTMLVTVQDSITNNSISPNQSVCINTQPAIITGLAATGGAGTPAYLWQRSTDSINWIPIPGANGISYTPPVLTSTTWYRRIAFTTLCPGVLGSFSLPVKITVREDARADFTATKNSGCTPFDLGTVIQVNTYPDRNGQYQWFANGVSVGTNPAGFFPGYIMPNSSDTVIVQLKTLSQYGCKADSVTQQFITFKTAVAQFTKGNAKGCGPLVVPFTNTSNLLNGIEFFWDFGNGITSTDAQPGSINFEASPNFNDTTYYVTLKAYNGCDTTVWRDSVEVRANPKARFGVPTTSGCSPFTLAINNTSLGGPNTYYWDFGNGDTRTTTTTGILNYTYNTGTLVDTFTIQLIAENECGTDITAIDIRIAPNVIVPQINIGGANLFGCVPHVVRFINSTPGATGFRWDFGDGTPVIVTSNNETSVTHTYNKPGDFTVKIDITNGCSDTTAFRQVTVYAKPKAAFNTNAQLYCIGDTVKINNSSTDATNYRWFWGDGQSSAGETPLHVYTIPGDYDIVLRAERTNNFGVVCFDTVFQTVSLLGKPDVQLQSNINISHCAPFTATVTAPAIINEAATWYFYDTTVTPSLIMANGVSAQYTFNNAGTFKVKMVAVNAAGCTDSVEKTFTVRATPEAAFTPGDLNICKTDTIIAWQNTSILKDNGPLSYRWLVDGVQLSTNGNFTHRYVAAMSALPRQFLTQLVATNILGCSDTASATVQLNPLPVAQFSLINPSDCVPFSPVVVNNATYTDAYQWLLNGQPISTEASPAFTITQAATPYTLTLVANNVYGCKADTFAVSFTSRIKPTAAFTVNDTLGCNGTLNVITANRSANANAYTWNWGDGSPTVAFNSPTHLYNNLGRYAISLIASDGVCRDTAVQFVTISTNPVVEFAGNPLTGCGTTTVQFSNLTQNATDFSWYFGDGGMSNSTNPVHDFAPRNSPYSVKLVAYNTGGCKDSLVKPNYVLAKIPPAADFNINPSPVITIPNYTFSFTNLTPNSNKYTYQWDLGDGTYADTRDVPDHKYADTGNYIIQLTVLDTNMTCSTTVVKIARIDGIPGYLYVPNAFYPNSIQTQFRSFKPLGKGLQEYHLQIFDAWGKLLFETRELDATGAPVAGWDGTFKGQPVKQDTYAWRIRAVFKNGKQWDGMVYDNIPGKKSGVTFGTLVLFR
ncbi:MAG TPA: PKD domain-containing protein [Ferruginibacter sp.]|nr:PKD domain-containing protein [Ferruginibacter sp.]HMP19717.1 PKD domain-containing protein [Ferruginibacter sp.]